MIYESKNPIADWCLIRIENANDYFVPTTVLWKQYCDEKETVEITLEQLENILQNDSRFYVTSTAAAGNQGERGELLSKLGFPATSLVGLAGRKPSQSELDSAIRAKAMHMRYALQKAWEARPAGDEQAEERLLFLLEQADRLCEALGIDTTDNP